MSGARGRPTVYTQAAADEILARLTEGETLRSICRTEGMPSEGAVRLWVADDRDGFAAHYAKAREAGYLRLADELLEIADDASRDTIEGAEGREMPNSEWIARSRLRVDTRKWVLAKMLPKVYGDKVTQEHTGPNGGAQEVVYRWAEPPKGEGE